MQRARTRTAAFVSGWVARHPNAIALGILTVPLVVMAYSATQTGVAPAATMLVNGVGNLLQYLDAAFVSVWFAVFLVAILILERIRPADPNQAPFLRALVFDAGVGIVALAFEFMVIAICVAMFIRFFRSHLPALDPWVAHWPNWLRVLAVLLVLDFSSWLVHLIRHQVPMFWQFHALHHSQRAMNVMTEFRLHPVDMFVGTLLKSFALYVLLVPTEQAFLFILVQKYYLMFLHANVDISYGPLDRIFVSPRVHRQHHAAAAELHHGNYGAYLTIWDWLFGTLHRAPQRGLRTGVDGFPNEHEAALRSMPLVYLRQLLAPFVRIFGRRRGETPNQSVQPQQARQVES